MSDIIEDIFCRTNLMYISELHEEKNYSRVLHAIRELEEQDYTQAEWAEAYQYIAQDEPGISKAEKDSYSSLILEHRKEN